MAQNPILPPPPNQPISDTHTWRDWFYILWTVTGKAGLAWLSIDFTGSKLSDIQSRDHNVLTAIQGGTATEHYHLSAADYTALTGEGNVVTATTTYAATSANGLILADATSAAFTITLPTAVGIPGKTISIKKVNSGSNSVTVATTGGQTIDGQTSISIPIRYDCLQIKSNGANWDIV